jgi:hypothetical protein
MHKGVFLSLMTAAFIALAALAPPCASAQPSAGPHLVQAIVEGLTSPEQAAEVGQLVSEQAGVRMSRFDVHTRNMMLHVDPSCTLDRTGLADLLAPFGITLRCYIRRPAAAAPFQHLDPGQCGTLTPDQ